MDIEAFPEIENFQKLPRQVIVKAGSLSFEGTTGARLSGIVINNSGHSIKDVRVHVVVFDGNQIPLLSTSLNADPSSLPQGGIANFNFEFKDSPRAIENHHLYTRWSFDDED